MVRFIPFAQHNQKWLLLLASLTFWARDNVDNGFAWSTDLSVSRANRGQPPCLDPLAVEIQFRLVFLLLNMFLILYI